MSGILTHQSAGIHQIVNMIRLLDYIYEHQPTRDEACTYFDISQATFKRQIAAARFFGADVRAVSSKSTVAHYAVSNFGIFSRARVQKLLAEHFD